jgi:hypothetical protein
MNEQTLADMAHEIGRVASLVAQLPAVPASLLPGDVEWLEIAHAAGSMARTAMGDHKMLLAASQRLAMAAYLTCVYFEQPESMKRVMNNALNEWEYVAFAARRCGHPLRNVLKSSASLTN